MQLIFRLALAPACHSLVYLPWNEEIAFIQVLLSRLSAAGCGHPSRKDKQDSGSSSLSRMFSNSFKSLRISGHASGFQVTYFLICFPLFDEDVSKEFTILVLLRPSKCRCNLISWFLVGCALICPRAVLDLPASQIHCCDFFRAPKGIDYPSIET